MTTDYSKMSLEDLKTESNTRATRFEMYSGASVLNKACGSALHRLLVEKGIVTEREIIESFLNELDIREK